MQTFEFRQCRGENIMFYFNKQWVVFKILKVGLSGKEVP